MFVWVLSWTQHHLQSNSAKLMQNLCQSLQSETKTKSEGEISLGKKKKANKDHTNTHHLRILRSAKDSAQSYK